MWPFVIAGGIATIDLLLASNQEESGHYYNNGTIDPKTGKELPEVFLGSLAYEAGSPIEETCWGPDWYEKIQDGRIDPKTGVEVTTGNSPDSEVKPEEFDQVAYAIGFLRSKRPTVDPSSAEQLEEWLAELNGYMEDIDRNKSDRDPENEPEPEYEPEPEPEDGREDFSGG